MSTHKRCPTCKVEKDFSEFYKDKNRKDGIHYNCKECSKQYTVDNKEDIAAYKKQYHAENKESIKAYKKQWFQANKNAIAKQQSAYQRNRRATDPTYKLIYNHRRRISSALDGKGKAESSIELLGCTPEQYRHHIESEFTEGMAWNQRGLWQVDHYHPLAAFDMTLKKHQKYAFHWSNCRPMWAEDNLEKSDKHCPDELSTYLKSKLPKYEDVYPV